jgi:hypothetical protein
MVDAAKSLGFSAEAEARDRCQSNFCLLVDQWLASAIASAKTAKEMNRDQKSDADLAGR